MSNFARLASRLSQKITYHLASQTQVNDSLIEVRIQSVHVHPDLLMEGHANRSSRRVLSTQDYLEMISWYGSNPQHHELRTR